MYHSEMRNVQNINPEVSHRSDALQRRETANFVPFFLRSWWLRDRVENKQVNFGLGSNATLPLWSLHADPLCDGVNLDSAF